MGDEFFFGKFKTIEEALSFQKFIIEKVN
jgi:hypothetical protein